MRPRPRPRPEREAEDEAPKFFYFSPYLYNRVWSELTCRNLLSHSRLACSRLSAHIQPSVNNPDTNGAANFVVVSIYNGHEFSHEFHCLQWNKLATLVYSTVDSGLTYT